MCSIFTTPRFPHLYESPKYMNDTSILGGERVSQHKMRMKKKTKKTVNLMRRRRVGAPHWKHIEALEWTASACPREQDAHSGSTMTA